MAQQPRLVQRLKERDQVDERRNGTPRHADADLPTADLSLTAQWPEPPAPEAYYGLAGEIARTIEPHSEADPVALLLQVLVAVGNAVGRHPYFVVEGTRHFTNLFLVLLGITSKGRKGTSWDRISALLRVAEEQWIEERAQSGLSSGEGVIWAVRDPIFTRQPIKQKGRVTGYETVETDPGIEDKRLMVVEPEFANVLKQIERQGNTLSVILRRAWETGSLRALTKNSPAKATGAHVSIVGHVTVEELTRYLSSTESASGFGNRFLWALVRRSKCLPEGGGYLDFGTLSKRLGEPLAFAKAVEQMKRDDAARDLWHSVYPSLSEGKPGLVGALTSRAEAQTLRLSMLYALLDCSWQVQEVHLKAALALWEYCDRCTRYVFKDSTGNNVADDVLRQLRAVHPGGLTRTEVRDLFDRHVSGDRLNKALGLLLEHHLARFERTATGGRPSETWYATKAT